MTEREFWQTIVRHIKGAIAHINGIAEAIIKYKLDGLKRDD